MSMVAQNLDEARVLDLFAGSGSYGLEALSRGALSCLFVEKDRSAAQCLRQNLGELERRAECQSLPKPSAAIQVRDAYEMLGHSIGPFDLVFCDPPYAEVRKLAPVLFTRLLDLTSSEAVLVLEASARDIDAEELVAPAPWREIRKKCYGDTMIIIWSRESP